MIYQMAQNISGIETHAENPKEILSVLLIYLTSILYRGRVSDPSYDGKTDLLKLITDYQSGAIGKFEDLLVKLGTELSGLKDSK
jgi:hypothetical protein